MEESQTPELSEELNDPRIGIVLQDRYRLLRKLGEGGMGAVYEAEHLLIRKRVAIKCLHPELAREQEAIARFHREARAASAIGHHNIIEVNDMGQFPDGTAYMVLEYLIGREWKEDIHKSGAQPLDTVIHIVLQVCEALSAAHEKGIIHRDLKPENIFLLRRGKEKNFVKVLDFGISKVKDAVEDAEKLTQAGLVLGTPYYMSPEQASGKDIDHRSDIFSLGVIMFEALTTRFPFRGSSIPTLLYKIVNEPPPSLQEIRSDLPRGLESVINKMLAKDPDDRYPNCAAVAAALELSFSLGLQPPSPASQSVQPRQDDDASLALAEEDAETDAAPRASEPESRADTAETPVREETPVATETSAAGAERRAWPRWLSALAITGVVVIFSGGLGLFSLGFSHRQQMLTDPVEPTSASENLASGSQHAKAINDAIDAAPSNREIKTVNIKISTDPSNAELFLDGDPISNPFNGSLPVEKETRSLKARHDGFRPWVQELSLLYEQDIHIKLRRDSGTEGTQRIRSRQHRAEPRSRPRPAQAGTTSTEKSSPSSREPPPSHAVAPAAAAEPPSPQPPVESPADEAHQRSSKTAPPASAPDQADEPSPAAGSENSEREQHLNELKMVPL